MDQIVRELVRFERFTLDLNRCALLIDDRIVDLRPKAFEVLQHLAANAGQLVSKDELYEVGWPGVIVGDDSLSQCIHELRQLLGDTDRNLIKTISRRGYLLDAQPVGLGATSPAAATADNPIKIEPRSYRRMAVIAAICVSIVVAAGLLVSFSSVAKRAVMAAIHRLAPQAENLLSPEDAQRLAALAAEKDMPIPPVRIEPPADDLPDAFRRLIGIWVSDEGWIGSRRQFMVIVTHIDREGTATGYMVNGRATPGSRIRGPGFSTGFVGYVDGGTLRYDGTLGMHLGSLAADGRMEFKLIWPNGVTSVVLLSPFWLLPPRNRAVAAMENAATR
jgi:DNA-binding winged helix-turn-helix (wHTH) protein